MGTGFFPGTGNPRAWSQSIALTVPYTYLGGNLLIESRSVLPGTTNLVIDAMFGAGQTTGESAFFGNNPDATVANSGILANRNWAIALDVVRVPEPESWLLASLGACGVAAIVRRQRRGAAARRGG
jgi:hypothetical protein